MRYQAAAGAAMIAGMALLQSCPAPVWAIVPAIAGIIAQTLEIVVDHLDKREDGTTTTTYGDEFYAEAIYHSERAVLEGRAKYCMPVPKGIGEHLIRDCCNSLKSARIKITGKNPKSGIKIEGIPANCIPVVPWIDGAGAVPYACGSNCIQYSNLSKDEYNHLRTSFLKKRG
ncbi:hypothetical protein B0J11DRAFT_503889 [Dendryphion nanum]|uniref:Uncharacterized protein n=1 Tax=Dendryphion nanum TaxID=256645 RepID=A0A9P9IPD8_9PLEO|nr:hypothetical protein B0J11DRAFT_503889 [Dendryphion nanum]